MSDKEKKEEEKKRDLNKPPSIPPPSKPPLLKPPSIKPPSMPPASHTPTPSPQRPSPSLSHVPMADSSPIPVQAPQPQVTIPPPTGPSQQEYDKILNQLQEKDKKILQFQNKVQEVNSQLSNLNTLLLERDNQINIFDNQIKNLQASTDSFQDKINELMNENSIIKAQLSAQQQENAMLQQQISPLQVQISKLQEDLSYKEKRIQELKEPKAVMSSSLASHPSTIQSPSYGYKTSISSSTSKIPESSTSIDDTSALGKDLGPSGARRVCPNCGASGFAIKEIEDKSKIISYIPKPIYAKKHVCTKCSYEF